MTRHSSSVALIAVLCAAAAVIFSIGAPWAIARTSGSGVREVPIEELRATIASLRGFEPLQPDLGEYIVDKLAAQQLGKAFFWDMQVGSDGNACASCHFHAGADIRVRNQVSPGLKGGDKVFNARSRGRGPSGPNKEFAAADFPFHQLENPLDRESAVVFDTNDVFSSQGTFGGNFVSISRNGVTPRTLVGAAGYDSAPPVDPKPVLWPANETCTLGYDPVENSFHANNLIHRKVEPRQTPTNINAVFNFRQFWDGRANNLFNGVDPFGPRTFQLPTAANQPGNPVARQAGTLVTDRASAVGLRLDQLLIENSSLASQAVGPALSDFEMSCGKKSFADLARKLIPLHALAHQRVHAQDSLLAKTRGLIAPVPQKGLTATYGALIERAFHPKFWSAAGRYRITEAGDVVRDQSAYSQMEHNFSLFWGLAVQEYEALLISDDSPFDRGMNGDPTAMSEKAKAGQLLFLDKAGCSGCHFGPLLSGATVVKSNTDSPKVIERMRMSGGYTTLYDTGFYNIGVRPTAEDRGVGATDGYGFDLSFTRQYKWQLLAQSGRSADRFQPNPCKWVVQFYPCSNVPTGLDPLTSQRDAVDGSFKAPILRNVGLNPPYFHNGGQASLRDVVRFYSRGGDRRGPLDNDTSGLPAPTPFGQINRTNLDPDIGEPLTAVPTQHNALGLTDAEIDDLVQFLLSLTDNRVACHADVFDHPELPLAMGQMSVAHVGSQVARDIVQVLPAVGRLGLKSVGKPCFPNSGDLFNSVNADDPTPLQPTFARILAPGPSPQKGSGIAFQAADRRPKLILNTDQPVPPGSIPPGSVPPGPVPPGPLPQPPILPFGNVIVPPPVPAPRFTAALGDIKGFTTIGFLQSATVSDSRCPGLAGSQWGGTATINNVTIIIPCNTVLQMPAATFTWADLFDAGAFKTTSSEPARLTLPRSGERFGRDKIGFPSTEIRIEGNFVAGQPIAGLVYISQQTLNTGTGLITGFEYENGVIYVSGKDGSIARLQLNDPNGRFSKGQSPDTRFSVDSENPTIKATTGYPMCVPRTDPSNADDPLCPQRNRPRVANGCRNFRSAGIFLPTLLEMAPPSPDSTYCNAFVMKAPPGTPATPRVPQVAIASPTEADARQQAPFAIGDLITYSGTLLRGDGQGPGGTDTISVHTITANVGIYTQPSSLPAYLAIGEFRVATFAPIVLFNGVPQEEQDRIVLEASVTDVTSIVDIYLVDIDPVSGRETQRWITPGIMTGNVGAIGSNGHLIDGGITTQFFGAQPGRVRIRATKAVPGILTSPTRYARVAVRSLCDPANINAKAPLLGAASSTTVDCLKRAPAANGLYSGQYMAPNFNFIFPENLVAGDPIVPANFWDLGFLVNGEGPGTGRLAPTPW